MSRNLRFTNVCSLTILHVFFFFMLPLAGYGQELAIANTATYVGSGRYDWTVFLEGSESTLNTIECVEYTLHPSFPNPVRKVCNRGNRFSLSSNGWGEFNISVRILFKDGRVTLLSHMLNLKQRPGAQAPTQLSPPGLHGKVSTENTSRYVGENRWDWTVFIVSDEKTLGEVGCVEYTLHPTFPNPVRKVCDRGSVPGRGFFLSSNGWGTFGVGVKVIFRDGNVTNLKHQLRFTEQ
jgi:transcription initiation factor IIF auxiliary subunit